MFGVRDDRIKERLLREADLTLNKASVGCLPSCRNQQATDRGDGGNADTGPLSSHNASAEERWSSQ